MLRWFRSQLPQVPHMDVGSEWTLGGRVYYVAMAYDEQDQVDYWREYRFTPCYALQAAIEHGTDDNLIIDKRGRVARLRENWQIGLPRYEDTGFRFRDLQPVV